MLTGTEWNWDRSILKNKKHWDELLMRLCRRDLLYKKMTFFLFLVEEKVDKYLNT